MRARIPACGLDNTHPMTKSSVVYVEPSSIFMESTRDCLSYKKNSLLALMLACETVMLQSRTRTMQQEIGLVSEVKTQITIMVIH